MLLHCHLKALVHHHMHCSDRTARERFSFGFALGDAPFFEQFYVELLHIPREDRRDFLIAEIRTDVCIRIENILVQRLRAHHILLIAEPAVEPFVQVHEAIFVQFHPAIGFEELIKFRHCLALRLAEDRFVYRLAVLFVSDDNACFPSSVRSFSDHPVPVRTSFTHVFHLLSRTTISQSVSYIQRKSKELSESYQFAPMFFLCLVQYKRSPMSSNLV